MEFCSFHLPGKTWRRLKRAVVVLSAGARDPLLRDELVIGGDVCCCVCKDNIFPNLQFATVPIQLPHFLAPLHSEEMLGQLSLAPSFFNSNPGPRSCSPK